MVTYPPAGTVAGALNTNLARSWPAGISRLSDGVVVPAVTVRLTTALPTGAGLLRNTQPFCVLVPACITVGVTVTDLTPVASTVTLAVLLLAPSVALIGTRVATPAGSPRMVKV